MNDSTIPMLAPAMMDGRDAGRIMRKSIVPSPTLRARAESMILRSTVNTPFSVLIKTGQTAPMKMINIDENIKVGKMAMA